MLKFKLNIIVILILSSSQIYCQSIQFIREKIELHIFDSYSHVKGTYYFQNIGSENTSQNLYYPFVVNNDLPYPDSISIRDSLTNKIIDCKYSDLGVTFALQVPAKSIVIYTVHYYQRTPANMMEYILTTTQRWKQPLIKAEYLITAPLHLKIKFLSMQFELLKKNKERTFYFNKEINFMPVENIIIKWKG